MHKGKPVIISNRPWYRHHVFPWGWYSLIQDNLIYTSPINADGYHKPNDGGGGTFKITKYNDEQLENSGTIIVPKG